LQWPSGEFREGNRGAEKVMGSFRLDYKFEIEYKYDFDFQISDISRALFLHVGFRQTGQFVE